MSREQEFRQSLARLQAAVAIRNAQVMANPLKYLNEMNDYCNELLGLLDKVEYALSSNFIFDLWDQSFDKTQITRPEDINGEASFRCSEALRVLSEYKLGR